MPIFSKTISARLSGRRQPNQRPIALHVASVVFAAMTTLGVGAARADDQPSAKASGAPAELEEIVVTARYRAESLQNTPIAITALGSGDLEARGITDVTGLTASAPSTSLVKEGSTGGNTLVAYIRGLGQANYSLAFQPGVPIYLDDIYQPTAFGSLLTLGDVERVDVLRGPQGTLFGKNSEGGAVSIRSVDPKGDNSGYFEAGVGTYNTRRFRGAFDTSLIPDTLFARVAAGSENSDGYVDRFDYACANPGQAGSIKPSAYTSCKLGSEGGLSDTYARVALKWLASDSVTVRLSASTIRDNDQAVPEVPLIINPTYPGSDLALFNSKVAVPLFGIPINSNFINRNPYANYATFNNPASGLTFSPTSPQRSYDITGKLDWNLPGHMVFTSITGYHNQDGTIPEYKDGPIPINMVQNRIRYESYSEEDRLSGTAFEEKLEWTAGLYYFHGQGSQLGTVNLLASQVGPFFGINEILYSPTTDRDESAYLHGVYHFTDKFSLEAGARYSNDKFTYIYTGTNLAQTPPNPIKAPGTPVFGAAAINVESKTSRVDPKVALQYQWTPHFMTYAEYATGFKGGGTNPTPITAAQATPFSVERLKSYEIGAKSEFFDNRITVNADVYYNDVTGLQLIGFAPTTIGGTITLNAGQAKVKGVELEIQARPIPALVLNVSGDYMHFRYGDLGAAAFSAANPGGLFTSDLAPFSPEEKVNVGIQYSIGLGSFGILTPRVDDTYQSRIYFDAQNNVASSQGGYSLVNGHLNWVPADGKWSATLDVNNLTNKLYYLSMFNQLSSFGILTGQPGMPRNMLFTVKYTY
ncbi:MAG: TonB-dependent receptor-like protein [Gammaproteobacteria bacterium]|nr:TonB-dependent receptor-like protein [Gammaproteobacteria bacterium]